MDAQTQTLQNRIVVGADFSGTSSHALNEAMRLARLVPGTELHLIYVLRTDKQLHDADKLDALERELREKVEEMREHVINVCAPQKGDAFSQELTVHVRREARGEWICLDAETSVEPDGAGLARSTLSDADGPVAHGAQSLLVAPRPPRPA